MVKEQALHLRLGGTRELLQETLNSAWESDHRTHGNHNGTGADPLGAAVLALTQGLWAP